MPDLVLATASYRAYVPAMGVPVVTSLGMPKGMVPHEKIGSLLPFGVFGVARFADDPEGARREYRHRLHQRSGHILDRLTDMQDRYPGVPLVLLCWEVSRDSCHRGWLAEWLSDKWDLAVPELPEKEG